MMKNLLGNEKNVIYKTDPAKTKTMTRLDFDYLDNIIEKKKEDSKGKETNEK